MDETATTETWPCGWLMYAGRDEDGELVVVECGAVATENSRGWTCTNGHEHVTAEARYREGWDYASDAGEAAQLRKYGTDVVAMDGGAI
jgi:hypothetical protein